MNISIVDFHSSNIKSVTNFFKRNFEGSVSVFDKPNSNLQNSDVLVIPGVGHFGHAANYLRLNKLDLSIKKFVKEKKPVIGICLGAQLMGNFSEEAPNEKGLGLLDAECISLSKHPKYKQNIPRIGWSGIMQNNFDTFYFVHSYFIKVNDLNLKTTYSKDGVTAMIESDNLLAMQFHPEKSNLSGEKIVKEFIEKHV